MPCESLLVFWHNFTLCVSIYLIGGSKKKIRSCLFIVHENTTQISITSAWVTFLNFSTIFAAQQSLPYCFRTVAFTFPYGLFKSTAYGFEMGSVGSRVLFTLQQHIWSMIPLIFGMFIYYRSKRWGSFITEFINKGISRPSLLLPSTSPFSSLLKRCPISGPIQSSFVQIWCSVHQTALPVIVFNDK